MSTNEDIGICGSDGYGSGGDGPHDTVRDARPAEGVGNGQATARPWLRDELTIYALGDTDVNRFYATVQTGYSSSGKTGHAELEANAALIVEAVNAHEAAVKLSEVADAALLMLAEISHYVPDEEFDDPDGQNVNTMRDRLETALAAFERARKGGE